MYNMCYNSYKTIYNKSERVSELVDDLFEFAKFENNNYKITFEEIDLDCEYPIIMSQGIITMPISKEGIYALDYDGKCTLFPDRDQRDWSKFERFWD